MPLSYLALEWNLPVITPRGNTRLIRNTTIFPNIISLHPFDKFELVRFTIYLLDKYKWEHLVLFADKDTRVLSTTGDSYYRYLETAQGLYWSFMPVHSKSFTDEDYDAKLLEASLSSRVFVLLLNLNDLRRLMLRAAALGMTTGDYVYIVPEFQGNARINSEVWRRNDKTDIAARRAFRSVLFINILSLNMNAYQTLIEKMNRKLFGEDSVYALKLDDQDLSDQERVTAESDEVQQEILTGYYNAVMMYLEVANETLHRGGNISDGVAMVNRMSNRNFQGISGRIHINKDGHRDTDMALVDMTDPWNGTFERVGTYKAELGELVLDPGTQISWPGGDGPVMDIPECGFQDQLCLSYTEEDDSKNLTIGLPTSISVILIAVGVITAYMLKIRSVRRIEILYWWKMDTTELMPVKRTMTKSTISGSIGKSKTNTSDACTVTGNTSVVMYKESFVCQHFLSKGNFHISSSMLKELGEIRDLTHPNLLSFIGASLEGDKPYIVCELCPKGTLQELLISETKLELDMMLQVSLVLDIVNGLTYLHRRNVIHGRLTSDCCYIDPRFSIKIAFFGLPSIYDSIKLAGKEDNQEINRLWIAPEHLRQLKTVSQEGDIYSLAIIMSEILSREEPYSNDKDYLGLRELLYKIQFCETPPFRPAVTCAPDMFPLENLMKQCWDEDPANRPNLQTISKKLSEMTKHKHGNVVDNLLERLEKYSSNLEQIVDEKIDELRQEKHKTEILLQQMLPVMVADRLKAGMTVEPELFECVTIYFSDIVGFPEMCSQLKPVQIINLLNELYSNVDEIIGHYDVYKIDTIGDAYMVVSGLPEKNGNDHAREIARMSLSVIKMISKFSPQDVPEDRVMLRVGIHSGAVCAGVVGLKTPRYCLFGESVNTATAMEKCGMEWKIHMSATTAEILKTFGTFLMNKRGEVELSKEQPLMETYWLLGEKTSHPAPSEGSVETLNN